MSRRAVYAGTFDPLTLGHLWVIEKATQQFDKVVVAIGVNPEKEKKVMFTLEERMEMLRQVTSVFTNVQTGSFVNLYLVNYAESINADFIIRGVRNSKDEEYEETMKEINKDINPEISTVFFSPPPKISKVASSVVKGLIGPEGWEKVVSNYVPPVVLKKLIASHHTIWRNLIERGAQGDETLFWEELFAFYMDDSRAYHNWSHICSMLTEFYKIQHLMKDPLAVEMAIWFHDAVYDVKSKNNEEKSAELVQRVAGRLGLSEEFSGRVARLILATRHDVSLLDSDAQFLIDLDLMILGKQEKEFNDYEKAIRKEYEWVSDDQFALGRAKILQSFLDRPSIFLTDIFREKYEDIARKNIERSIIRLQRG